MWMQFQWHPLTELRSESKLLDGQAIRRQPYKTLPNLTKPYKNLRNLTKRYKTLPNQTKPYKTWPNHTKPYKTLPNHTNPNKTKPHHNELWVKTVQYDQEILTPYHIRYPRLQWGCWGCSWVGNKMLNQVLRSSSSQETTESRFWKRTFLKQLQNCNGGKCLGIFLVVANQEDALWSDIFVIFFTENV